MNLVETFKVAGVEYECRLAQDLSIDRNNLSEEFAQHSVRFSWYATAYELAQDYEQRLKIELEKAYAQLDVQARTAMEAAGVRVTEKKVENTVITHNQYVALHNQFLEARLQTGLLKAARDSMMAKKDCLVSLGANMRAELASNPSINHER